jgi:hypothetical protein
MPRTQDLVQAAWNAALAAVVGYLPPSQVRRRILTIAVTGPANSTLRIYRGYVISAAGLISAVYPADDRLYDSTQGDAPIVLAAGEPATFAWTAGATGIGQTGIAAVTAEW